jgi:hypothetical protein
MAESAEGARLLSECRVTSSTEGSNPSLSANTNREADAKNGIGLFDNDENLITQPLRSENTKTSSPALIEQYTLHLS